MFSFLTVLMLTHTANFGESKLTDKEQGTFIGMKASGAASVQPVKPQTETSVSMTVN